MTREDIAEINEEAIIYDGFDSAIIGYAERINLGPVVAYDVEKMIKILIEGGIEDYTEALEYFEYNIRGAWVGDYTPVFIYTE